MRNNTPLRNYGLDLLKYLCAFLVVCIHSHYPGDEWLEPFTRFAVPVFFMITGYFYRITQLQRREVSQIRKILNLTIISNLLYFLKSGLLAVLRDGSPFPFLLSLTNSKMWMDFLLLNESPFSGHLWYLGAMLYVLALIWFFEKKWTREKLYPLIPLLLTGNLLLGTYSASIFGFNLPNTYSRNFLFVGLPFFLLGDYISGRKKNLSTFALICVAILAAIGTHLENTWLMGCGVPFNSELYISTIFLSVSLFFLVVQNTTAFQHRFSIAFSRFVKPLPVYIYICHPIIDDFIYKFLTIIGSKLPLLPRIYHYCSPIIVFAASTIFAWVVQIIMQRLTSSRKES